MLKSFLKNLGWTKKSSKVVGDFYRRHKKKVFDIILYGSAARGKHKPRDFDVLIIFRHVDGKEYFDLPYELRKKLEKELKVDVKGIMLEEFFDAKFLARQGVLIEGFSLISGQPLGERLGLERYSLFVYSIKTLTHNEKTKFQYALKGRGDEKGMLKRLKGTSIGIGTILMPIENSEVLKEFLDSWKVKYEEWRGLFIKA